MTLRIVTDGDSLPEDPEIIEQRELIKKRLGQIIDQVDKANLTSFVFVGMSQSGQGISGRLISTQPYAIIGLLEYEKQVVLGLIEEIGLEDIEEDS